jgi:MFS family permease
MQQSGIFANRWWIVVASVIALIASVGSINVFAFGVFLKPVSTDLGFSRGTLSSALLLNSLVTAVVSPFFGRFLDRFGVRAVMLPSILLFALTIAGFSLLSSSIVVLYCCYALSGLTCMGQTTIGYSKIVSQWFDKQRGLALGITTAGVGLGTALIPQFAEYWIQHFGWRVAYVGLGAAIFVLAFVPVLIFVREPKAANAASAVVQSRDPTLAKGLTLGEAVRDFRFWSLMLAFFLAVAAINGTLTHVIALLTDRGLPVQVAANALSKAGISLMAGRIVSGYCVDRFWGPYVAALFFACPLVGIFLLDNAYGGYGPSLGVMLCGIGIGGELDFMAFFVSRYFGIKAFGQIYGWIFGVFTIGTGAGPYVMGAAFDAMHSYALMFKIFEGVLLVVCLIFVFLGPYRFPREAHAW